jgi:hypothetical protein
MNKKGQIGLRLGIFFAMLVIAVVGVALLTESANTAGAMTQKQSANNQSISTVTGYVGNSDINESINYSIYSQSAWKVLDCPLTSVAIRNGAGTTLTVVTDYTLDANNGRFSLVNTSNTVPATALNLTYADYSYCADGYNKDSGSRAMVGLIILFFAMAIAFAVLEYSGITNLTGWFN